MKFIDQYLSIVGLVGSGLTLGVILLTVYKLISKKKFLSLLIFALIMALFFLKAFNHFFLILAVIMMYIQLVYYVFFLVRGFRVKHKVTKKPVTDYPPVAILIPVKNESQVIEETLLSVSKLNYPQSQLEIIVIDDGSTDNTLEVVSSLENIPNLKIIHHPEAQGKANSINQVLQDIQSDYVLILDADHLIDKNFIMNALQSFSSPDVVCVQRKNVIRNGGVSLLSTLVEIEYEERYEIIMNGRGLPQFMGSAGMFNTRILREMGGFNPDMLTEDFEFSHRAYLKNYRIVFDSSIKTYELASADFRSFFFQRHRWFRGNWKALTYYFKDLFKSNQIPLLSKIELINNYSELASLVCYLFICILFFVETINIYQFDYKSLTYVPSISLFLIHAITVLNYRKYKLLLFLIFIPFYYIVFAAPNLMAILDNCIVKSEYKWNKTDRSMLKVKVLEEEVAATID